MNDVTVVIVHWNNPDHLSRCLDALAQQTVAPDRIIVVDNASENAPRRLAISLQQHDSIRWIWNRTNVGFAAAVNQAVGVAQTRWVTTLNPDAFVAVGWLESLLNAAEEHNEFTFFGSALLNPCGRIDGAGDALHVSGLAWRQLHGEDISRMPTSPKEVMSVCAAAAMFLRSAFLEVGGMDERYFCYFEDVDLAVRLRQAGHRCLLVPQAVAYHIGGGSGVTKDTQIYYGHRNLIWTFWKSFSVNSWRSFMQLANHLLYQFITLLWHAWRGHPLAIWRAKWDGFVGLLRIRKHKSPRSEFPLDMAETGWLTPLRK